LTDLQDQSTNGLFTFSIIVVDNDDIQSAKQLVESFQKTAAIRIEYFNEPEQNIARARNMAVRKAEGNYIAFIDDDEFPMRQWLFNLHTAIKRYGADGILGPVVPNYETKPPEWIIKGRFFERPSHKTGTVLDWTFTRTGNVLFRKDIFNDAENIFRVEFGSGGEDRDFFRRMIRKGHRFLWCEQAPVYEVVPPERLKRSFMLRRALLRGKIPQYKAIDIGKSVIAVPIYTAMLPFLLFVGQHTFMKYLIKNADHIGRILSLFRVNVIKQKYIMK
jgi:succinoglycan biosynthesis protein ExoM